METSNKVLHEKPTWEKKVPVMHWWNTYTWMVQDEIQRIQKEEKQTEKRIKNIIFNNKKQKCNSDSQWIAFLFLFLQSFARLNNNINLTRYHEKEMIIVFLSTSISLLFSSCSTILEIITGDRQCIYPNCTERGTSNSAYCSYHKPYYLK